MVSKVTEETRAMIDAIAKRIFDELEDIVTQVRKFDPPNLRDDYDKLHLQTLFYSETEREYSYLYRKAWELRNQVETYLHRAQDVLEDAKMEAVENQGVKLPNAYSSRVETEARLRSQTFEEVYEVRIWEKVLNDVKYLLEVIKSYQMDAYKQRKDIDTRLKIKGLQL